VVKKTESKASEGQINQRQELFGLFDSLYREDMVEHKDLFQNLGLFLRCSALTKLLFINELYEQIINVPGIILEFGVHLGQNLVTFENLRALYEPWNQNRRIVGFDTFHKHGGYASRSDIDGDSPEISEDTYRLPDSYPDFLRTLLKYHESDHILAHIPTTEVIVGDVVSTVPVFFEEHRGDIVALAYFDLATYKPTSTCLEQVLERLVPGSILLMDELNFSAYPGASVAFREFVEAHKINYKIMSSRFMRDRSIVIYQGRG